MALALYPDAVGDHRNALYLGTAADLAYLRDPAQGATAFRDQLGLDAVLISVDNTQAYVGQNDSHIVLAFRGSESPANLDGFKDWLLTNANNFLILPEGEIGMDFAAAGVGARFHRGFLAALAAIWTPMFKAVNEAIEKKERPLWITGHSLGGALALVAAWRLQRQFVPIHQVYTFGAPMIGNELAARAFEKEFPNRIFRYIDECDLVPRLPTMSLLANDYNHCLKEVVLSAAEEAASALAFLKSVGAEAADNTLSTPLVERVWGRLTSGISAHLTANYLARIATLCKD